MREDPLERKGSPRYPFYSTFGQNLATIVPVSYFLTVMRGQVRCDVSARSTVSRCCWQCRTSSLAIMLQKCMAISVLSSWLKSWRQDLINWHQQFLFHLMTLIRILVLPRRPHALCVNRSHMPLDLIMWSKLPSLIWPKDPLFQILPPSDQESSALPYRLASPCDCWVIIAKTYQVVSCLRNLWPFIIPSSLNHMANFVPWPCLFISAPWVHRVARLFVTPLSMASPSQLLHW
jgi:hypothetical protein